MERLIVWSWRSSRCPAPRGAPTKPPPVRKMHDLVKPSLVAVKYTWTNELGSQELTAAGVIVSDDGLVAFPIGIVTPLLIPDDQMQKFKIVVPSDTADETEIDATFQGRDERTSLAFVRPDSPQKWKPIKFADLSPKTGDPLYSVGMLPKGAGYKAIVTTAIMSTRLRGPVPQILVSGQLAGVGSVVLDAEGHAIGMVHARSLGEALLDNPENPDDLPMVFNPPRLFIPAGDFLPGDRESSQRRTSRSSFPGPVVSPRAWRKRMRNISAWPTSRPCRWTMSFPILPPPRPASASWTSSLKSMASQSNAAIFPSNFPRS